MSQGAPGPTWVCVDLEDGTVQLLYVEGCCAEGLGERDGLFHDQVTVHALEDVVLTHRHYQDNVTCAQDRACQGCSPTAEGEHVCV